MNKKIKILPLIPLRGLTIFPYMVLHFDVGRTKSINALEEAMLNGQKIFLAAQKEAKIDDPEEKDIAEIGVISNIKQILKLPGDTVRVLVEGENRAKIINYVEKDSFLKVEIELLEDEKEYDKESEALVRTVKKVFYDYVKLAGNIPPEIIMNLDDIDDLGRLCDVISSYLILEQEKKQKLLDAYEINERLEQLIIILKNEVEILKLEKKIGLKVKSQIDKVQKEYFLKELKLQY
ncbi:Lon protease 1 [Clostridium acetireducens DSM 10703]|uniref:Lon protease 1 n=1 Tax=Clostridium acetireducens DSM 10703 TaxID=1121290 RepID=A0A1E8EVD2_9CLOT|nr:Lon protease 1 [Clostridium acetireducens DSM 10703]